MGRFLGSLNARSRDLLATALPVGEQDGWRVSRQLGATILDFGVEWRGSLSGGLVLAGLCTGNLAPVTLQLAQGDSDLPLPAVEIRTDCPLDACMVAQYAGWPIEAGKWFGMGSGPGRLHRLREPVLEKYALPETAAEVVVVVEASSLPPAEGIRQMASECHCEPEQLTVAVARTASLAGTIQIVARSIETSLHKLFELEFDLACVHSAAGRCPLPPVGKNDLQSIGWTNDAILYGSQVWLWVDCGQDDVDRIAGRLPACSSADFGRPFGEIFERYGRDFYAIDRLLFSPARATIFNLRTGLTRVVGELRHDILRESLGLQHGAGIP